MILTIAIHSLAMLKGIIRISAKKIELECHPQISVPRHVLSGRENFSTFVMFLFKQLDYSELFNFNIQQEKIIHLTFNMLEKRTSRSENQ